MRKLFFTIISALSLMLLLDGRAGAMTADDRYAIVVGIGNYPPESGWSRIHGDRDVKIVTEMLLKNGFPEDNIFVLVDSAATKSAIEAAFRELAGTLSEGDIVYVHFSAHGQQVTDIDGDEPDGLDEAVIPYDARKTYIEGVYHGENHIVDDELNIWLASLRKAVGESGQVIVAVDACHSGDSTRGDAEEDSLYPVRGTSDVFSIPESRRQTLAGQVDGRRNRKDVEWISLGACRSYQNNFEVLSADGYCGRLTWALSETLEQGMDYQDLVNRIEKIYEALPMPPGPPQNLEAEAPEDWNGTIF